MPDCQSGAVHSVDCGTIIGIAVASEHSVFVTPIVTRGKAAKPHASKAAAGRDALREEVAAGQLVMRQVVCCTDALE